METKIATTDTYELAQELRNEIEVRTVSLYDLLSRLYMLTKEPFHHFASSGDSVIVVEAKIVKPDVVYATMPKPEPIKARIPFPLPAPEKKKAKIARLTAKIESLEKRIARLEQWKSDVLAHLEATREIAAGDDY